MAKCTCKELQIGTKVKITKKCVEDNAVYICSTYIQPATKEFEVEDLPAIHFWLTHYLNKTQPKGEVVGYGAEEDRSPRKNLRVSLNIPGYEEKAQYYNHHSVEKCK